MRKKGRTGRARTGRAGSRRQYRALHQGRGADQSCASSQDQNGTSMSQIGVYQNGWSHSRLADRDQGIEESRDQGIEKWQLEGATCEEQSRGVSAQNVAEPGRVAPDCRQKPPHPRSSATCHWRLPIRACPIRAEAQARATGSPIRALWSIPARHEPALLLTSRRAVNRRGAFRAWVARLSWHSELTIPRSVRCLPHRNSCR